MRPRSEPKPDCAYCRGAGIISVSKDPDLEADCVCTDPPEPTAAEKVDAFAQSIGVELMPWQRELAIKMLRAEPVIVPAGRRAGMGMVRRVVGGARRV